MKFLLDLLFWLLLFETLQGSTLPHRRPIRSLDTTLKTNFSGTFERKNSCCDTEVETSSYIASHELHHHTNEDDWSYYTQKCSAIISNFLRSIGNLIRSNHNPNGSFNFYLNTSISQKQDFLGNRESCESLPTIVIEATDCKLPLSACCKVSGSLNKKNTSEDKTYQCGLHTNGETDFSAQGILFSQNNVPSSEAKELFKNQFSLSLPSEGDSLDPLHFTKLEHPPCTGGEWSDTKKNLKADDNLSISSENEFSKISSPSVLSGERMGTEGFPQAVYNDLSQVTQSTFDPNTKYFKTSLQLTPLTDPKSGTAQPPVQYKTAKLVPAPAESQIESPFEAEPNVVSENLFPQSGRPEQLTPLSYHNSASSSPDQQIEYTTPTVPSFDAPQIPIGRGEPTSQPHVTEDELVERYMTERPDFSSPNGPQPATLLPNKPSLPFITRPLGPFNQVTDPEFSEVSLQSQSVAGEKYDNGILPAPEGFGSLPPQPLDTSSSSESNIDQTIFSNVQPNNFPDNQNESESDLDPLLRQRVNKNMEKEISEESRLGEGFSKQPFDAATYPVQPTMVNDYSPASELQKDINFSHKIPNFKNQFKESSFAADSQLGARPYDPTVYPQFQTQPPYDNSFYSSTPPSKDPLKTNVEDIFPITPPPPTALESDVRPIHSDQITNLKEEKIFPLMNNGDHLSNMPFRGTSSTSSSVPVPNKMATGPPNSDFFVTPSPSSEEEAARSPLNFPIGSSVPPDFSPANTQSHQGPIGDGQSNESFRPFLGTPTQSNILFGQLQSNPEHTLPPYSGQFGRDTIPEQIPERMSTFDPRSRSESTISPYMNLQEISSSNKSQIQLRPETSKLSSEFPYLPRQDFGSFEPTFTPKPNFKTNDPSALNTTPSSFYPPTLNPERGTSTPDFSANRKPISAPLISSLGTETDSFRDPKLSIPPAYALPLRQNNPLDEQTDFQRSQKKFLTPEAVLQDESATEKPTDSITTSDYHDQFNSKALPPFNSVGGESQTSPAPLLPFPNIGGSSYPLFNHRNEFPVPKSGPYQPAFSDQTTDLSPEKQSFGNFEPNFTSEEKALRDPAVSQSVRPEPSLTKIKQISEDTSSDTFRSSINLPEENFPASDPQSFTSTTNDPVRLRESFPSSGELTPDMMSRPIWRQPKTVDRSKIIPSQQQVENFDVMNTPMAAAVQKPNIPLHSMTPNFPILSQDEAESEEILKPQIPLNKIYEGNPENLLDSSDDFTEDKERELTSNNASPPQPFTGQFFPETKKSADAQSPTFTTEFNDFSVKRPSQAFGLNKSPDFPNSFVAPHPHGSQSSENNPQESKFHKPSPKFINLSNFKSEDQSSNNFPTDPSEFSPQISNSNGQSDPARFPQAFLPRPQYWNENFRQTPSSDSLKTVPRDDNFQKFDPESFNSFTQPDNFRQDPNIPINTDSPGKYPDLKPTIPQAPRFAEESGILRNNPDGTHESPFTSSQQEAYNRGYPSLLPPQEQTFDEPSQMRFSSSVPGSPATFNKAPNPEALINESAGETPPIPQETEEQYFQTPFESEEQKAESASKETATINREESQSASTDFDQDLNNLKRKPTATNFSPLLQPNLNNFGFYPGPTAQNIFSDSLVKSDEFSERPLPQKLPFREETQQMSPNFPKFFVNSSSPFQPASEETSLPMKPIENPMFSAAEPPLSLKSTQNFHTLGDSSFPAGVSKQQQRTLTFPASDIGLKSPTATFDQNTDTPNILPPSTPKPFLVYPEQSSESPTNQQNVQSIGMNYQSPSDSGEYKPPKQEIGEVNPAYLAQNVPFGAAMPQEGTALASTEPQPFSISQSPLIPQERRQRPPQEFDSSLLNSQDKSLIPYDQSLTELQPNRSRVGTFVNYPNRANFNSNEFSGVAMPAFDRNAPIFSTTPPQTPQHVNFKNQIQPTSPESQSLSNEEQTRFFNSDTTPLPSPYQGYPETTNAVEETPTTESPSQQFEFQTVTPNLDETLRNDKQLAISPNGPPAHLDIENSEYQMLSDDPQRTNNYGVTEPNREFVGYNEPSPIPQRSVNNNQQVELPNQRPFQVNPDYPYYQRNHPQQTNDMRMGNSRPFENPNNMKPSELPPIIQPINTDKEINTGTKYPTHTSNLDSEVLAKEREIFPDERRSSDDPTEYRPQGNAFEPLPRFPSMTETESREKLFQNAGPYEPRENPETPSNFFASDSLPPAKEGPQVNPLFMAMESHTALPIRERPYQPSGPSYSLPEHPNQNEQLSFDSKNPIKPDAPSPSSTEWDPRSTANFVNSQSLQANAPIDVPKRPEPDPRALVPDQTIPSNAPGEDYVSCCGRRTSQLCPFDPTFKGNMTAPSYYILVTKLPEETDGEESFRVEKVYLGDGTPINCTGGEDFASSGRFDHVPNPLRNSFYADRMRSGSDPEGFRVLK